MAHLIHYRYMKILMVHNYYQQSGGEDTVFRLEKALLQKYGHQVIEYTDDNRHLIEMHTVSAAVNAIWSRQTQRKLKQLIRQTKPDIAHFHNTFLMISPAAYYTCQEENIPVVQTLHNYRLLCPGALFFRNGEICEDCLSKKIPLSGIVHACWRDSTVQTSVVVAMLTVHRLLRTWQKQIDQFIVLTEFAKQKFIEGGIPQNKISVNPNFLDPDSADQGNEDGRYALFVGRLSPEKGVQMLLQAWRQLTNIPLKIVGTGAMESDVISFVKRNRLESVQILGAKSHQMVLNLMQRASFLVFPSVWYEGFPMTIVEAFACGTPVIASKLGGMAEIVVDGLSGLHFEFGNVDDLRDKVVWAFEHPAEMFQMGRNARKMYETKYTAERNYQMLIEIYNKVLSRR